MDLSNESVIHMKKGDIEYLQFRKLLEYKDIIDHVYTLIPNNMDYKVNTTISEERFNKDVLNYKKMCDTLGFDYTQIVRPVMTHSNNVNIIDEKEHNDIPDFRMKSLQDVDGLITDKKDLFITTTNADCNIFLLFDPVKKVIANVHSGWRGTLARIGKNAINEMINKKGCNPEDIICCICPTIRKCHFEVSEDVKDLFENEFKDLGSLDNIIFDGEKEGKYYIDTVLINKLIFERLGLKSENIIDSNICSVCNKKYVHSYRAEGKEFGVNAALIRLK